MGAYLKNWKTNLGALAIIVIIVLRLANKIDSEAMLNCLAALATYGFIVTKDASRKDV